MGREEQIEEREVLDSIFPDEITGKPPYVVPKRFRLTPPCTTDVSDTSFRVSIALDLPGQDEDSERRRLSLVRKIW